MGICCGHHCYYASATCSTAADFAWHITDQMFVEFCVTLNVSGIMWK